MPLKRVTITGADDMTVIDDLVALYDEFPFVEFGLLVHASAHYTNRFPSYRWLSFLFEVNANRVELGKEAFNLSMHLCGDPVTSLLSGNMRIPTALHPILYQCGRLQINTHAQPHMVTDSAFPLIRRLSSMMMNANPPEIIFQADEVNEFLFKAAEYEALVHGPGMGYRPTFLIDGSHGAGISPERWRTPPPACTWFGFAGGLGPDNIEVQFSAIERASTGRDFWIDMEGKVCTPGAGLDIPAVRKVLEACKPWIDQPIA